VPPLSHPDNRKKVVQPVGESAEYASSADDILKLVFDPAQLVDK
jgi:hypothetical protein